MAISGPGTRSCCDREQTGLGHTQRLRTPRLKAVIATCPGLRGSSSRIGGVTRVDAGRWPSTRAQRPEAKTAAINSSEDFGVAFPPMPARSSASRTRRSASARDSPKATSAATASSPT